MYSHTKKVGSLGRYGARVGRKLRNEARNIEDRMKEPKKCPQCGKARVKRKASGIWSCSSCTTVFAGGAYSPVAVKKEVQVGGKEVKAEKPEQAPAETPKEEKTKKTKKKTKTVKEK